MENWILSILLLEYPVFLHMGSPVLRHAQSLTWRPKTVIFLPHSTGILQKPQLPFANIINHTVQCETTVVYGFVDSWVLLEDFDGLLDVQLSHSGSAGVIIGQTLKLGLVLSA